MLGSEVRMSVSGSPLQLQSTNPGKIARDVACSELRNLTSASQNGAREPWTPAMARPVTDRSANAAKLDVALPLGVPEAFVRLVEARNAADGSRRVYTRDLHEEALAAVIQATDNGAPPTFQATPYRLSRRKTFWVDEALKAAVNRIAQERAISLSAVVVTAFQLFLDKHGAAQHAHAA